mgnify:CR=1 FL=1
MGGEAKGALARGREAKGALPRGRGSQRGGQINQVAMHQGFRGAAAAKVRFDTEVRLRQRIRTWVQSASAWVQRVRRQAATALTSGRASMAARARAGLTAKASPDQAAYRASLQGWRAVQDSSSQGRSTQPTKFNTRADRM